MNSVHWRQGRDNWKATVLDTPEPRVVPAKDTALFRGALLLIERLESENKDLRDECDRLKAQCAWWDTSA